MAFLNTLVEFEGVVVNVRARYWAAHCEALAATGLRGPTADEFWRLVRIGAPDGQFVPHAKPAQVIEYKRARDARIDAGDLMQLDEAQPEAGPNLRLLKSLGSSHLVTLSRNRDGINATLDRLEVWMHFDQKRALPQDRDRRVETLRELVGAQRTLAVVGTLPMAYAAGEAGCRVVALRTGLAFPKQFQQMGVDVIYDDLEQLTEALTRRAPELQKIGVL
jgi:phosphoglycolate phosphatase-like HAD superfamily hydrolase